MAIYYQYYKLQKYQYGIPVDPPEYKRGELVTTGEWDSIEDCEKNINGYIWKLVDNQYICHEVNVNCDNLYTNNIEDILIYDDGTLYKKSNVYSRNDNGDILIDSDFIIPKNYIMFNEFSTAGVIKITSTIETELIDINSNPDIIIPLHIGENIITDNELQGRSLNVFHEINNTLDKFITKIDFSQACSAAVINNSYYYKKNCARVESFDKKILTSFNTNLFALSEYYTNNCEIIFPDYDYYICSGIPSKNLSYNKQRIKMRNYYIGDIVLRPFIEYNAIPNTHCDNIELPENINFNDFFEFRSDKTNYIDSIILADKNIVKNVKNIDFGDLVLYNPEKISFANMESLERLDLRTLLKGSYLRTQAGIFDSLSRQGVIENCKNLKELLIPEYNEIIHEYTVFDFDNVENLETIPMLEQYKYSIPYYSTVPNVILSFNNCRKLKKIDTSNVTLEEGVGYSIDDSSFIGCDEVEEINIVTDALTENEILNYDKMGKVIAGHFPNFSNLTKLRKISIKNLYYTDWYSEGELAFYNCSSLEEIDLGKAYCMKSFVISSDSFYNCVNLKKITCSTNMKNMLTSSSNINKLPELFRDPNYEGWIIDDGLLNN